MNRIEHLSRCRESRSGYPPEDKVLRRRQQYRIHQQRHRARLKNRMGCLQSDVDSLSKQIATLESKRKQMQQYIAIPHRTVLDIKLPLRFVTEFLQLFKHGYNFKNPSKQETFLRTQARHNLELYDIQGLENHIDQWKLYGRFFKMYRIAFNDLFIQVFDSETIVTVRTDIAISPTREGVLALHPRLNGCERGVQKLVQTKLAVPTKLEFHFDTSGLLCKFFVSGCYPRMLRELNLSPDIVELLFNDMRISSLSGVIYASPSVPTVKESMVRSKLNIQYLLGDKDSDNSVMS
ncbi:unnamed protein product [Albugo candida]|uniref:BZIP domain-containing protein n=1 Tax=Albugo candida TaxID=65357 RepID=A0A024G2C0_9STRA|nr:unnamed protein product [Albugo candida]|eukprot:CCI40448.1 unnamed protein product [Albugo candida]